jgi:cell division GTPase FtsZ
MFKLIEEHIEEAVIVAVGVGTVGCKILSKSISKNNDGVIGIFIHSNEQFLVNLGIEKANTIVLTSGKATSRINTPRDALLAINKKASELEKLLKNSDIVFVVAGLGGATGSGCSPYIMEYAQQKDTLCIGMFSLPFEFEGRGKKGAALRAYSELIDKTDSLLLIENDMFLKRVLRNEEGTLTGVRRGNINPVSSDLFYESNIYFSALITGLSSLVCRPGLINVDHKDLRAVLKSMGPCKLGYGIDSGINRAQGAILQAVSAAEDNGTDIASAKGCVINITAGPDFSIAEFEIIGNVMQEVMSKNTTIVLGTIIDLDMENDIEVTVTFSGLKGPILDMSAAEDGFFTEVVRTIEFESHQASSGIAILSYFGEVIKQKHTDIGASVRIEQTENSVVLIIETPNGEVEKIEKTLEEYGEVILGKKTPAEFLPNKIDAQRLEFKLEMTSMELRQNEKLLLIYQDQNSEYKGRLDSLEQQVHTLQKALSSGLTSSNKNLKSLISKHEQIPSSLLKLLEAHKKSELSQDTIENIELKIRKLYAEDRVGFFSLTNLIKNGLYGVAGNSMYNFLINLVQTLPK